MLLCPVRDCRIALVREDRRLFCPRGHSFDVARSGYINLLQPQERRSSQPGDTAAALAARRRLHDCGATGPLLLAIAGMLAASPDDIVLDAGCGDGFYLGTLARQAGFRAHGVDISVPAIDAAARRYPGCEWIVANADRLVPYADRSFTIVLSITARMNSSEFRRVLRQDGRLLVAVPAPDDLSELRGVGRDRVPRTVETFAHDFTLAGRRRVSTTVDLDAINAQTAAWKTPQEVQALTDHQSPPDGLHYRWPDLPSLSIESRYRTEHGTSNRGGFRIFHCGDRRHSGDRIAVTFRAVSLDRRLRPL
ncbi:MAG: methyltransferase domain-containing protein [Acidobacteria bacterium]|nr:methyltransferase domain-containing protein [Acidobacteriota bacterium]